MQINTIKKDTSSVSGRNSSYHTRKLNMEKQQLIKYLRAVVAAEKGIEYCDYCTLAIDREISMLHASKPEKKDYSSFSSVATTAQNKVNNRITGGFFALIAGITIFGIVYAISSGMGIVISIGGALVCAFFIGLFLLIPIFLLETIVGSITGRRKQTQAYDQEIARYNLAMEKYNAQTIVNERAKKSLNAIKNNLTYKKKQLENTRDRLYSANIIYRDFRNLIAVSQILAYLEMGVADTLEGPNGAYKEYLKDVRTKRICNKLEDLQTEIGNAFRGLQNVLIKEMRISHQKIDQFSAKFTENMNDMRDTINNASNNISSATAQCCSRLDKLDQKVNTMSWNQYIFECQNTANSIRIQIP